MRAGAAGQQRAAGEECRCGQGRVERLRTCEQPLGIGSIGVAVLQVHSARLLHLDKTRTATTEPQAGKNQVGYCGRAFSGCQNIGIRLS